MQHSELYHLVVILWAPNAKYIIIHAHRYSQIVQRSVGNQSITGCLLAVLPHVMKPAARRRVYSDIVKGHWRCIHGRMRIPDACDNTLREPIE